MSAVSSTNALNGAPPEKTVAPTDEEIVAQLATLQTLHEKVFELRSLLPERLIGPVKAAVESSGSNHEPPAALAKHLSGVAVDGDKDVKEFKEQWRSESMKDVWANAKTASFPQGSDVWSVDYRKRAAGEISVDSKDEKGFIDEDIDEVVETFRSTQKLQLHKRDDGEKPAWDLVIAGQNLTIEKSSGENGEWRVQAKRDTHLTTEDGKVLRSLQERPEKRSLRYLLGMISSYKDLKTRPCDKCQQVIDDNIQLPTIRTYDPQSLRFLAYHQGCQPQS